MALTRRGGSNGSETNMLLLPLPAATVLGDLLVVVSHTGAGANPSTDDRLTEVASISPDGRGRVYVGHATHLGHLTFAGTGSTIHASTVCAVFEPTAQTGTPTTESGTTPGGPSDMPVPSVGPTPSTICVQVGGGSVVADSMQLPDGYTFGESKAGVGSRARIDFWNTVAGEGFSPASTVFNTANEWGLAVIPASGAWFNTVRKYPVDRGRGWPPPRDRSRGRRVGGYQ